MTAGYLLDSEGGDGVKGAFRTPLFPVLEWRISESRKFNDTGVDIALFAGY